MANPTANNPCAIARTIIGEGATDAEVKRKGESIRRIFAKAGGHRSSLALVEIADAEGVPVDALVRWLAGTD